MGALPNSQFRFDVPQSGFFVLNLKFVARRQWEGYPPSHTRLANVLLHVVGVPVFLLGNCVLVVSLASLNLRWAGLGLLGMLGGFALQIVGHGIEPRRPPAFASPSDAIARIFVEQWLTFPRYLLSRVLSRRIG